MNQKDEIEMIWKQTLKIKLIRQQLEQEMKEIENKYLIREAIAIVNGFDSYKRRG